MNASATERVKRIVTVNLDEDEAKALRVIMSKKFQWVSREQSYAGWSFGVPLDFITVLEAAISGKNLGSVYTSHANP